MSFAHSAVTARHVTFIANDVVAEAVDEVVLDALAPPAGLRFLSPGQWQFQGRLQGRSLVHVLGLLDRILGAAAPGCRGPEQIRRQPLLRLLETRFQAGMPVGYVLTPDPDEIARVVSNRSAWSVLALGCQLDLAVQELFTHRRSRAHRPRMHDEAQWRHEDARLAQRQRDRAVEDLVEMIGTVDRVLRARAATDAEYFLATCGGPALTLVQRATVRQRMTRTYRWCFASGARRPEYRDVLTSLATPVQLYRITQALRPMSGV
jgi:hypothetical protein